LKENIDHLFETLVLSIFIYGVPVHGASNSDLIFIQHFLDKCHKGHFTSQPVSIFNLLEQQDRGINNHMPAWYYNSQRKTNRISFLLEKVSPSSDKTREMQENFCK